MGSLQLCYSVGSVLSIANMSKFLIASCLAIAAVSAEADPGYLVGAPALLNAYPNWPGVSTPYSQSTCYGCRGYIGKRSADADAYYGYPYGYARRGYYGYGGYGYGRGYYWG